MMSGSIKLEDLVNERVKKPEMPIDAKVRREAMIDALEWVGDDDEDVRNAITRLRSGGEL